MWGEESERGPLLPNFSEIVRMLDAAMAQVKPAADDYKSMPPEELFAEMFDTLQSCRSQAEQSILRSGEKVWQCY